MQGHNGRHDNLNQWFDDVKKDLVATGLVEEKAVLDEEGKLVSEVCFKCDSQRRIINMDEAHHNLSITGDRGGSQAVTYYNPASLSARCIKKREGWPTRHGCVRNNFRRRSTTSVVHIRLNSPVGRKLLCQDGLDYWHTNS
jgi:hypothetical protein